MVFYIIFIFLHNLSGITEAELIFFHSLLSPIVSASLIVSILVFSTENTKRLIRLDLNPTLLIHDSNDGRACVTRRNRLRFVYHEIKFVTRESKTQRYIFAVCSGRDGARACLVVSYRKRVGEKEQTRGPAHYFSDTGFRPPLTT